MVCNKTGPWAVDPVKLSCLVGVRLASVVGGMTSNRDSGGCFVLEGLIRSASEGTQTQVMQRAESCGRNKYGKISGF